MRRVLTAAVLAVLATAATAGAAPPRGLSFTDPAGDANFADGRTTTGSQAAFDVVRVTLSPAARTRTHSSIAVRIDLAAPAATTPGTGFFVSAKQDGCDIRVDLALGTEGWDTSYRRSCVGSPVQGSYSASMISAGTSPAGRSVTLVLPAAALADSRIGARITGIAAGTSVADPAAHALAAHPDTASHPGPYVVGR